MRIEIFEGFCIMFVKAKFIKIEALTQVFLCRFSEIFKNIFFIEHIWATAYVHSNVNSMLKRGGNGRLASTWNTRGVFVGIAVLHTFLHL